MRTWATWGCAAMLASCGGSPARVEAGGGAGRGATLEAPVELCHDSGGPNRTDYAYVAGYECPDGSVPLGTDEVRGAQARVGNVGQGPDGHVVDLYEVPCADGPVRVYVDAYHCAHRDVDIDPDALTPSQLRAMADGGEGIEDVPFHPEAIERREGLASWAAQSPQLDLELCDHVIALFAHRDYEHGRALWLQYQVSMMVATVLGPDDQGALAVQVAGVEGALRMHDAIVRERGAEAADPELAELLQVRREGRLEEPVREAFAQCHASPGLVMMRDGRPVWPPTGPDCDAFVRCCESQGLVRNGAAVAGTAGSMCLLLAAGADEEGCTGALAAIVMQGATCEAP